MGTIIHKIMAVTVDYKNAENVQKTLDKIEILYFVTPPLLNGYVTFMIPSIGSKVGFGGHAEFERKLGQFKESGCYRGEEFVEVVYGSDANGGEGGAYVVSHS